MSTSAPASPPATSGSSATSAMATSGSRRINRSISATWWYTVSGVMMFQVTAVLIWVAVLVVAGVGAVLLAIVGVGGVAWCATSMMLLIRYRHRDEAAGTAGWRGAAIPALVAVALGVTMWVISGSWVMAVLPVVQTLMLLNWPRGVRLRLVIAVMVILAGLWCIDLHAANMIDTGVASRDWLLLGVFSILLPAMTVLSLWWWDVLVTLDRARTAEARLGAAQERLRVATDVHDLQGHHLQVIALQLELAERLFEKHDADAALEQLRLARESVADARQGTRDLAMRFRGVPLLDEIANAVDLLRAAGITADAAVEDGADRAPASVLGPVIRETTTNVLRHGGGMWARLSLARLGEGWRYEIANDMGSDLAGHSDGTGLDGISRRVAEAGGSVEVRRGKNEFAVVVTLAGERR